MSVVVTPAGSPAGRPRADRRRQARAFTALAGTIGIVGAMGAIAAGLGLGSSSGICVAFTVSSSAQCSGAACDPRTSGHAG
jgi:hypothetical protein